MRRFIHTLFLFMVCITTTFALPRVGVLPLPIYESDESFPASEELRASIQQAIVQNLSQSKSCDVVVLQWPEFMNESETPNFETLVQQARAQNCSGVVFVRIENLRFVTQDVDVPILGQTVKAEAEVAFSGGLVDVVSAAGVAPIRASSKKTQQPAKGPDPSDLEAKGLDDSALKGSALGQALLTACQQVAKDVLQNLGRLSSQPVAKPARTNAPEGLRFEQDTTVFTTLTGYDRRGMMAVTNASDAPRAFKLLPISSIKGVTAGFVGEGSIDKACVLKPGQTKYVRFILNTGRILKNEPLQIGLFASDEADQVDVKAKHHDSAVIQLTTTTPDARLKLEVLRQDPATLAYTCRLSNAGAAIWGVGVEPENSKHNQLVRFEPRVSENVFIPAKGSVEFTVIPSLYPGMPPVDVSLEVTGGVDPNPAKANLHFEVPAGQSVFYGLAHTSSSSGSFQGYCINQGGDYAQDPNGGELCTGLGHDWGNSSFSGNVGYIMGKIWAAFHKGGGPTKHDWNAVTGLRGGTIRKPLLDRLPELATQTSLYPCRLSCGGAPGIILHTPSPNSKPTVVFGIIANPDEKIMNISQLNDKGHSAMWPHACYLDTGKVAAVWVDAAQDAKSNVALRISTTDDYLSWSPTTYLTTHSKGVDDPFIITLNNGNLVVGWEDLRSGSSKVYMRISKDGGTHFGPEIAVPVSAGESQRWPQLAAHSSGIGLCYVSMLSGKSSVVFRKLDLNGNTVGKPQVVSANNTVCGEPSIHASDDGQFCVVWREGEANSSEIWFRKVSDKGVEPSLQLTKDSAYSEYPVITGVGNSLNVTYHSDISGVTDLQYRVTSTDGGRSWSQPVMLPSLQGAVKKAWLEASFALENSREEYPPFDMRFLVNNTEVGKMTKTVLEGSYLFPVPAHVIRGYMGALFNNNVETKVENAMDGHFIYGSHHRLIAQWAYSQIALAAASQRDADRIAASAGSDRNHALPDLVLAANKMPRLPAQLAPSTKLPLVFQVFNVGEAAATDVVLDFYSGVKLSPVERPKPLKSIELKTLAPGESVDASYTFEFNPKTTPRIHAVLRMKQQDFYPTDNAWSVSFTLGEAGTVAPTVGTDTPNLFYTPDIMKAVNISDPTKLLNMVSLPNFSDILRIPELPGMPKLELPSLQGLAAPITDKLQQLNIPVPDIGGLLGGGL